MGNITIFANAFKECGIGGKFSKFQIIQSNEWFELVNLDILEDSRFCFHIHDKIDHRKYTNVSSDEALGLHGNDPQWGTHLRTAQRAMAKILSKGSNKGVDRYYVNTLHQSVYLVNRMFVIEITPVLRQVPDVCSLAVYDFLESVTAKVPVDDDVITVHSKYGKVVTGWNGKIYNALLTPDEFNEQFGVAA